MSRTRRNKNISTEGRPDISYKRQQRHDILKEYDTLA